VDISEENISMNGNKNDDDHSDSDNLAGELDFDPDDDNVDIEDDVSGNDAPRGGDAGDYDDVMDGASSGSDGDEDGFGAADINPSDKDDNDNSSGDEDNASGDLTVAAGAATWASDDSEEGDDSANGDEEGCSAPKQQQPWRAKVLSSGLALADADDYEMLIA
jgi:hypothetical protein